jgi:hypothetical protein
LDRLNPVADVDGDAVNWDALDTPREHCKIRRNAHRQAVRHHLTVPEVRGESAAPVSGCLQCAGCDTIA